MREDATIDKRMVRVPYSSTIGFGKWRAQVGDMIIFEESPGVRVTGRMIGRVRYAPSLSGDTSPIRDRILCICISETLDHTYERWVRAEDVREVRSMTDRRTEVITWFLSDALTNEPIDDIRRAVAGGWNTTDAWRADKEKRAKDLADFERRHPKGVCDCKVCRIIAETEGVKTQ